MENYRELARLCAALRRAHHVAEPADKPIIAHAVKYYNDKLKEIESAVGRYCGPGGDYKAPINKKDIMVRYWVIGFFAFAILYLAIIKYIIWLG